MLKHFIWDFDGTLYNSYPVITQAALGTFREFNQPYTDQNDFYRQIKIGSLGELIQKAGIDKGAFDNIFVAKEGQELAKILPFAETKSTVMALAKRGGQQFILTHRQVASAEKLLQRDGLLGYFSEIVGADSGFPRKPQPHSLTYLLNKFQLNPTETLMVGDRRLDVIAGKNAGCQTCLFDQDGFLGEIPADYLVKDLAEILSL
ncbi:HAD-IA family hydrolase [Enterococcus sp. HY326]|uniref:HAD-IA family hydrolase n=1 Tax=Enterococcus sp. HY326 TaxID=2971265 RepID=UPI00223F142C|nr:HAD-IA family hydrolase [Enterococcus sp. HY326]